MEHTTPSQPHSFPGSSALLFGALLFLASMTTAAVGFHVVSAEAPGAVVPLGAPADATPTAAPQSGAVTAGNTTPPAQAQRDYSGIVKCDGVADKSKGEVECNILSIISILQMLITWFLGFSVTLCVGLFSYAGILYLSAKEDNIKTAKKIFINVVIGFVVVLAAWVLVRTVLDWVVKPEFMGTATSFFGGR